MATNDGGPAFPWKPEYMCKAIASVACCALGAVSMWITDGTTGIGWAILGLLIIW